MTSPFIPWRACLAATGLAALSCAASNWPQFRGPTGDGHADTARLPVEFGETNRVKWKTALHGRAWSSPVIWGEQVWLTTATEDAKELSVLCVNATSGKIERDAKLFEVERPQFHHKFNSAASPTPVIEAGRVYVTFGSPGTACLDTSSGKVLWQRRDLECNHFRGAGSSPILHGGLLLMNFDGSDHQFVIALDKNTGRTVWRTPRGVDFQDLGADGKPQAEGDFRKAFSTPHVISVGGSPLLLSSGAKAHYGYDPLTGRELWRVEERAQHSASSRPVAGQGMVFINTGFSKSQLLAVKLPERPAAGTKVLDGSQIAWRMTRSVPSKPSLLLVGADLFMIDDGGVASCVEAATGRTWWTERIGGNCSASPIVADGRVYFFTEEGKVAVVAAAREFRKLAENRFADGFMASPAVTDNALILRTKTHLYRVGE